MSAVCLYVSDLLFTSKVRETALHLGVEVRSARDAAGLRAAAAGCSLVIVDLRRPDALEALALVQGTRALGFVEHGNAEMFERARALGCDVVSKGRFSHDLPKILAGLGAPGDPKPIASE